MPHAGGPRLRLTPLVGLIIFLFLLSIALAVSAYLIVIPPAVSQEDLERELEPLPPAFPEKLFGGPSGTDAWKFLGGVPEPENVPRSMPFQP
jgi:hypothetical protein